MPTSITRADQYSNQLVVVPTLSTLIVKKAAPNQKTKFPKVSDFLRSGDPIISLHTRITTCRMPMPKSNCVQAE